MGNVLKPHKKTDLLALVRARISFREIARRLGVRHETVSKYATEAGLWTPSFGKLRTRSKPATLNAEVATGSEAAPSKPATGSEVATGFDPFASEPCGPSAAPLFPYTTDTAVGMEALSKESPKAIAPREARSACEPFRDWIKGEVGKGRNAVSIYQDLVERFGFTHRYNSVKRYVRGLKKIDPEQYDRLEFLPGEEAQVDYGQGALTRHPESGKMRRPRLFVMTLRYSRRSFRKVVWKSSQETWARLHEEAFRYFGGSPQYVVLDNLKEGVLKPDIYEPELNPVYAAMLAHYGVVADPARVRDPDRKGSVENAVQHTQNTALKGREFESIEAQNEWLIHWEERWASSRMHGRTKRQVAEMFAEEKPFLKPLPLEAFRYFEQGVRTVWDDGCVEVKRSYYSALPAAIFSEVVVRIYALEIEILNPKTLTVIRRHLKNPRPGGVKMEASDRIFNPSTMTESFIQQAARIGPKTRELCEQLFKEEGRVGQRKMRGILSLARRHPAALIEEACAQGVAHRVRSSRVIREMVERLEEKERGEKEASLPLIQSHELIRPLHEYALFVEECALQGKSSVMN